MRPVSGHRRPAGHLSDTGGEVRLASVRAAGGRKEAACLRRLSKAFVESVAEAKGEAGRRRVGAGSRGPGRAGWLLAGRPQFSGARCYRHNGKPPSSSLGSARLPIVCQAPRHVPLGSERLSTREVPTCHLVHRCVFQLLLQVTAPKQGAPGAKMGNARHLAPQGGRRIELAKTRRTGWGRGRPLVGSRSAARACSSGDAAGRAVPVPGTRDAAHAGDTAASRRASPTSA